MGVVKCNVHGKQQFTNVCIHIEKELNEGILPEYYITEPLYSKVCKVCKKKYDLIIETKITFDEALDLESNELELFEQKISHVENEIKYRAFCIECYKEIAAIQKQ